MRLIYADKPLDELKWFESGVSEHKRVEVRSYIRRVEAAPTVDAVPVVHGRYQKSEDKDEWYSYEYTCLKCGATMMVADADGNDVEPGFCAVCGTLLDGGAEDEREKD